MIIIVVINRVGEDQKGSSLAIRNVILGKLTKKLYTATYLQTTIWDFPPNRGNNQTSEGPVNILIPSVRVSAKQF